MKSLSLSLIIIQLIFINLILLNIATAVPDFSLHNINGQKPFNVHECPRIIARKEWTARNAIGTTNLRISPVPYVVIHQTGGFDYCYDINSCSESLRILQYFHMDVKEWNDIAYNFMIGEDGNVYEGRGWDYGGLIGNELILNSIGIAVIGNFTNFIPRSEALEALNNLIRCGILFNKITENYTLITHRQLQNKSCPGEAFNKYLMNMLQPTTVTKRLSNKKIPSSTELSTFNVIFRAASDFQNPP